MTEKKGKILSQLPKRKSTGVPRRDWDEFAVLAQQHPGQPVLAATHLRRTTVESVKTYRREPFYTQEGNIRVHFRNSKIEDDGLRYADMYFVWHPRKEANATAND